MAPTRPEQPERHAIEQAQRQHPQHPVFGEQVEPFVVHMAKLQHEGVRLAGLHADLRITQGDRAVLVAARRWKAATHGVEPLRELHAQAQQQGAQAVYVALTGTVSETARSFAREHGVVLLEGDALAALLLKATPAG